MNLLKCILTANDCYKTGKKITPKGVMVHSTGANNPTVKRYAQPLKTDADYTALTQKLGKNNNGNHWNRGGLSVCVHAFIGKLADGTIGTVQTLPWNHRGWHAGSGKKGSANDTHISFEICEASLTDGAYFKKVYQEAVELTAMLCKEYHLDPLADGVVICHSEGHKRGVASNHGDVMHWFPKHGKSMDTFRKDVQAQMGAVKPVVKPIVKPAAAPKTFTVQAKNTAVYSAPPVMQISGVYTITEEKNGYGKLKSGSGWVKLADVKRL